MPIRFEPTAAESGVTEDVGKFIIELDELIRSKNYDIRTIYSGLVVLTEHYRELMRSMFNDKDQFDVFIDTLNVYITSFTSRLQRPVFEAKVKELEET